MQFSLEETAEEMSKFCQGLNSDLEAKSDSFYGDLFQQIAMDILLY